MFFTPSNVHILPSNVCALDESVYPGSCPPKKLFLGRFFLENHVFDPFRPNEDPQVLYIAGKLWI